MPYFAVWARPLWKGAPQREFLTYTVDCDLGESSSVAVEFIKSPELGFCLGRGCCLWSLRAVAVTPAILADGAE